MTAVVIAIAVLAVVAIGYVLVSRSPDQTAGHEAPGEAPASTSDRLYGRSDRPAGPDAEHQSADPEAPPAGH